MTKDQKNDIEAIINLIVLASTRDMYPTKKAGIDEIMINSFNSKNGAGSFSINKNLSSGEIKTAFNAIRGASAEHADMSSEVFVGGIKCALTGSKKDGPVEDPELRNMLSLAAVAIKKNFGKMKEFALNAEYQLEAYCGYAKSKA